MDIADQSNDKGELKIYILLHVVFASVKTYFYYNLYFLIFLPERDSGTMMGRDRDRGRGMDSGPDKTDSDWRARPSGDQDEGPRRDDGYGDSELNASKLYIMLKPVLILTENFDLALVIECYLVCNT